LKLPAIRPFVPPESQKVNTANQTRTSGFAGAQFPPVMRSGAGSGLGCAGMSSLEGGLAVFGSASHRRKIIF
jgi:hypothetical protein